MIFCKLLDHSKSEALHDQLSWPYLAPLKLREGGQAVINMTPHTQGAVQ